MAAGTAAPPIFGSNSGRFRDRNPGIIPAGKCIKVEDTAKDCLTSPVCPRTPEKIYKFRSTTQSAPGQIRIFHGRYSDPDISGLLRHGIHTKQSISAAELVNPNLKSLFAHRKNEKNENYVYRSRQQAPLGCSHDQRGGLPVGVDPQTDAFGLPSLKGHSAAELVNPTKSQKEVEQDALCGHELYKISHSAYAVGETYDRKYNWSRVPVTSAFGIETPHDNRGLNTKKALKWLVGTQRVESVPVISKRVDDFRDRTIPQVGRVHDPIKDTKLVSDDHTYGITIRPDEFGAGDLIQMRNAGTFLRGKDQQRSMLAALRQHLKKANYHNFHDLKAAFTFYDKDKSGQIELDELRSVCLQLNLPVGVELLDSLLHLCDVNGDGKINYVEFANYLNWKDKLPGGFESSTSRLASSQACDENVDARRSYDKTIIRESQNSGVPVTKNGPQLIGSEEDSDFRKGDYVTSSSMINSVAGKVPTKGYRAYGIPTIRSDLPAPRIRRIGDNTNYGDESDSYGLVNPSIFSNHGVYEKEFFQARQAGELRSIFSAIGVAMTNETFQELWDQARAANPDGEVSVESFRSLLDEKVSKEYEMSAREGQDNEPALSTVIQNMMNYKPQVHTELKDPALSSRPTRNEGLCV